MDDELRELFEQRMIETPTHNLQARIESVVEEHHLPEQELIALSNLVGKVHASQKFFLSLTETLLETADESKAKREASDALIRKQEEVIAALKTCAAKWTERDALMRAGNQALMEVLRLRNPEVFAQASALLAAQKWHVEQEREAAAPRRSQRLQRLHPYKKKTQGKRERELRGWAGSVVPVFMPVDVVGLLIKALKA